MGFRIRTAVRSAKPRPSGLTIPALADRCFGYIRTESGEGAERYARRSAAAFLDYFGDQPADVLSLDTLMAFKASLASSGLKPKSQAHFLTIAKRIAQFGIDFELIPFIPLRRISIPSVPISVVPAKSPDQVGAMIHAARLRIRDESRATSYFNHLRLAFLGAFRLSEVQRLVAGRGVWQSPNCFVPTDADGTTAVGKCNHHGFARRLIVTDEARAILDETEPYWSADYDGFGAFSAFGCFYCDWPPRYIRNAGATAMMEAMGGDANAINSVQQVLGHLKDAGMDRVALAYFKPLERTCLAALSHLPPLLDAALKRAEATITLANEPLKKRRGRSLVSLAA